MSDIDKPRQYYVRLDECERQIETARREERELLDWLQANECSLVPHREKGAAEGWEIWWSVCKRGRAVCHPMGNPRDAIAAAIRARSTAEGKP